MKSAIVGLGVIGLVHAKVLFEQKKSVVALCDVDKEKAESFKKQFFPDAKIYTSYEEMLDSEDIDVVHICTPHHLHAQMCILALNKNVNVFCEKPLCISQTEIEEIIRAEKNSKAILGVCHQNRYLTQNKFLKKYLEKNKPINAYGTLVWNRDESYYSQATWRGKWATEGGGVMINQALHTLDILVWIMGQPRYVVSTVSNVTLKNVIEVEDTVTAIFSGNANFSFMATNGSTDSFPIEISILTKDKKIKVFEEKVIIGEKVKKFKNNYKIHGKDCYGSGHGAIIKDFYKSAELGETFWLNSEEASKVLKLIFAIYKSNQNKIEI